MRVLIDGVIGTINDRGLLMGKDITGRECPVADHGYVLNMPHSGNKNFKGITSGHVYILNYDPDTFTNSKPRTFKEYREMKENGEKINFR